MTIKKSQMFGECFEQYMQNDEIITTYNKEKIFKMFLHELKELENIFAEYALKFMENS